MTVDLPTAVLHTATVLLIVAGVKWAVAAPVRLYKDNQARFAALDVRMVLIEKRTDLQDHQLQMGQLAFGEARTQSARVDARVDRLEQLALSDRARNA